MASGRLGAADLSAATNEAIYTVPSGKVASVNITVCNRTGIAATIRLAHIDGGILDLADEDYIRYDRPIAPNGEYEKTGIIMAEGATIMAYANKTGISVQVYGWEEDA